MLAGSPHMFVPMDDEHHLHWEIMIRPGQGSTLGGLDNPARNPEPGSVATTSKRTPVE